MLSTGAHAALPHPAHEEIDVGRPEGCHILRQAQLAPSAPELAQRLCVGLNRAVRLALYCAGCEIQRDELFEPKIGKCNLLKVRWSHITPSCWG